MKIALIGATPHDFFSEITKKLRANGHTIDLYILSSKFNIKSDASLYGNIYHCCFNRFNLKTFNFLRLFSIFYSSKIFKKFLKQKNLREKIKFLYYLGALKNFSEHDVVCVQQLSLPCPIFHLIEESQKLLVSYWGSDLLRADSVQIEQNKKWLKKATIITMQNDKMLEKFKETYKDDTESFAKVTLTLFPISLEIFNKIKKTPKPSSKKINISIGYNGSQTFKHLEVLQHLSKLNNRWFNKIKVTLTFGYGAKDDYLKKVKSFIKTLPFEANLDERFHTEDSLAKLRKSVDLLIQVNISDGFSASIAEYLYAGTLILHGSWLPYTSYNEHKALLLTIDSLDQVTKKTEYILENITELKKKTQHNQSAVLKILKHEETLLSWTQLFERLQ